MNIREDTENMEEQRSLLATSRKKEEYLVMVCCVFNFFADSIELITPGVITQSVSCELELSPAEETVLSVVLYASLLVSSIGITFISEWFRRRTLLLFSSYSAVIVTVLCASVPNLVTLILSRILLGMAVGINYIVASVYATEMVQDRGRYILTMSLCNTALSAAGGWIGILSYLILERVGWRVFILLTSLPFFFPQLIMLQFFLRDPIDVFKDDNDSIDNHTNFDSSGIYKTTIGSTENNTSALESMKNGTGVTTFEESSPKATKDVYLFILRLGIAYFLQSIVGYGAIILLPQFTKAHNLTSNVASPCGRLHGSQFLFFTVTFGVCHAVGRLMSYLLQDRVLTLTQNFFVYVIAFVASVMMVGFSNSLTALVVCECFVQFYNAYHGSTMFVVGHSPDYVGAKNITKSAAAISIGSYSGTLLGTFISATLRYKTVLIINTVVAALNFPVLAWMYMGNIKIYY